MARFRKKPVEVDAWLFLGHAISMPDWIDPAWFYEEIVPAHPAQRDSRRRGSPVLCIPTLEGIMHARIGDWIIRGTKGEVYPCKPDIFDQIYEEVK